ncbi:CAP domain-containing protein [Kribbella sp. NPDC059898]|uniref:CAP domain-containing protein n=1 Tax=Kribbella sp. NPDC059898 TaxID=3346995 RepID=UPI00364E6B11
MTDSPTPRRHRGSRRAPRRSRGLVGPAVSALSVLVAIGPVVWLMSHGTSRTDGAERVVNVVENSSVEDGTTVDGTSTGPMITITKTLPNGATTTAVVGPAAVGSAPASSSPSPSSSSPSSSPSSSVTTPTVGVTTVTVSPTAPRSTNGATGRPKPSITATPTGKPTGKPSSTPTKTRTTEPSPSDTPQPPVGGGGTNAQERQVLDYTNQIRQQQGCGPLKLDSALVEAAGKHASDMVRRHYMDHTNPDGQDPGDRMAAAGYKGSTWGENIAAGYDTAQKVVAAWMQSDGHRKNILNCRYTSIGIGYDPGQVRSDYGPGSWVQDFGRS